MKIILEHESSNPNEYLQIITYDDRDDLAICIHDHKKSLGLILDRKSIVRLINLLQGHLST